MSLRLIAKALGISVTTVSRALADYSDVAEETRARVRAEAQRIGYVPNATARRLQKGRADAIGVALPSGPGAMEDSYLYSAFVGAWSRLTELGQDLLLLPTGDDTGGTLPVGRDAEAFHRAIEERRVDGVLLMRARREDPRIAALKRFGLPFVALSAELRHDPEVTTVSSDDQQGARAICERLSGLGHSAITCVVPSGGFDFALSRLEHMEAEARRFGMSCEAEFANLTEDGGREATRRILEAARLPPTALVYLTNRMTIGGLTALAASPWVVGRHVSVISYGDSATLRHGTPATTAIQAPMFDMARHAIEVLVAMRDRKPIEPIRRWPVALVVRQSDGPPTPPPAR
ncbi:MAG: LacI family DNA-binding transcriptional regulator [Siculibacillus sp.]